MSTTGHVGRGWLRTFTALRHHNYRLYFFGELISITGSWMQRIGQAWLVLQLTHSAWQLGLVSAVQSLPILLFSLFGGVFADRWPKRVTLLVTRSLATLQALLLWALIATSTVQIWHVYALALLLGLTNSVAAPTEQAFVVELVGREDLPNAVALNSSLVTAARIVGPGLAGIVIAASGMTTLFLLNAISFLATIVGLVLIRSRELRAQAAPQTITDERQNTWRSIREGLGYVWNTPAVLLVLVVVGLVLLFGSNFGVVLPLFATNVLHAGASGFGFLSAAIGVGSLLSTLWLAWNNQQPTIRRLLVSTVFFGGLEAAFAISHIYLLSLALIAGIGFTEIAFAALAITMLQTVTPDHLRGRVMSVAVLCFDGTLPLGSLLIGWLSALYGAAIALLIGAALCLLVAAAGWIWHKSVESSAPEPALP